jgi:hypothetical protein
VVGRSDGIIGFEFVPCVRLLGGKKEEEERLGGGEKFEEERLDGGE